ncbi:acyl-CoA synthetase family member 2, mitochondrial [Trichonephila clavipes]|nr:acyl-CoA synthetase family member 2, mitochondrial [Trichonephila clavipes]
MSDREVILVEWYSEKKSPDVVDNSSQGQKCVKGVYKEWWKRSKIVQKRIKSLPLQLPQSYGTKEAFGYFFLRSRIFGRLKRGRIQLEVSEELGIVQSDICRAWQRFQDYDTVNRCYSTGHLRVSTPNEDRYFAITFKRNSRSAASDLSHQLSSTTETTVSRQTVYRCLKHFGLYARRPVRCVKLTATHCHLRLTWIRERALWTPQQWSCVMFSDESEFSLQSDSHRTL